MTEKPETDLRRDGLRTIHDLSDSIDPPSGELEVEVPSVFHDPDYLVPGSVALQSTIPSC
jgi:hypothetical protein